MSLCLTACSKAVLMALLTLVFVYYNETTSKDIEIRPRRRSGATLLNLAMRSLVLRICAGTYFSSGLSRHGRNHPSLSNIPPLPDAIGHMLKVFSCALGSE